jgi:hypothetical protein
MSPFNATTAIMPVKWENGWPTSIITLDVLHARGLLRLEYPNRAKTCDFRALRVPGEIVDAIYGMTYDAESQQLLVVTDGDDNRRQTFLYRLSIFSQ